jgi:acetoin utilization protein AcuB
MSVAEERGGLVMRADELMTENPTTIQPTASLAQAMTILHEMDIRHLPVVDGEGQLVGMLSDRDLRGLEVPALVDPDEPDRLKAALAQAVSSVMNSDVLSVDSDADLAEVIDLMLDHKVGAVPVVDRERGLIGIVSYIDVLRELGAQL